MWEAWSNVTEGQGIIISSIITVVAALLGLVLGFLFYSSQVRDLQSALDETKRIFMRDIENLSNNVKESLAVIEASFASNAEALGQLRGSVDEVQRASEDTRAAQVAPTAVEPIQRLRDDWRSIRDEIERIAADPQIDGRTRAKYGRIDRRNYRDLIDALKADNRLGSVSASIIGALDIWQRYRVGKTVPTQDDLDRMQTYRSTIEQAKL